MGRLNSNQAGSRAGNIGGWAADRVQTVCLSLLLAVVAPAMILVWHQKCHQPRTDLAELSKDIDRFSTEADKAIKKTITETKERLQVSRAGFEKLAGQEAEDLVEEAEEHAFDLNRSRTAAVDSLEKAEKALVDYRDAWVEYKKRSEN